MASAAELAILLSLKDSFSEGMKNASKTTGDFGEKLKSMAAPLATLAAGFASFKTIESAIDKTVELGEATRKLSSQTGLTAHDSSAFISVLAHVGLTADDAEKSLGILAKNMENAAFAAQKGKTQTNPFTESMQALGVQFKDVNNHVLGTNEVLLDLADKFSKLQNSGQKTALAMDIFGKSGKDMLPVLNLGRDGIIELEKEADKLHVTLTQKNVNSIHAFVVSQREMNEAIGGLELKLGTALMPLLTDFANILVNIQPKISSLVDQGIAKLSSVLSSLAPGFDAIKSQVGAQIQGIINLVKGLISAIEGVADVVNDIAHGRWSDAWANLKAVAISVGEAMIGELEAIFGQLPNLLVDAVNKAIEAVNSVKIPDSLSFKGVKIPIPGGGAGLNLPEVPKVPIPSIDWSDVTKGFNSLTAGFKDLSKAGSGAGTSIGDLGAASKKTADEILGDALGKIRSAASQLFAQPTREFATLDLAIAKDAQAHMAMRPAIQSAIDSYNADADAHEAAAQAIEDSVARIDEVLQAQIDQAQDHVTKLQEQYDKEDQIRAQAQKLADRAAQDAADAADQAQQSEQRSLQDKLDSLNDQKSALPSGSEGDAQRKTIDDQINVLQDSLKAASRASQDYSHGLDEANKQQTRALEDYQTKIDAQRKKEQDDAQASLVWQQKQKDIADKRAKDEADAERAAAGKAKDQAEAEKRQLDNMDKEEAAMKLRLDALNGEHEIMKKQLVLADQSLLSEAGLKQKVDDLIPVTSDLTGRILSVANALGIDLTGGVAALIVQLKKLEDLPAAILANISGGQIPGHKLGLDRVPYDNYLMYAHKDERILTADEAKAYGNQSTDNSRRTTIYGNVNQYFGGGGDASTDLAMARLN